MKISSPRSIAPLLYGALTVMFVMHIHAQDPAPFPPVPPQWSVLEDADQDGLTDWDEYLLSLDPLNPLDGLSDVDGDELWLAWEWQLGTDSNLSDTDGDGWSDSLEVLLYGTDPLDPASKPPGNGSDNHGDVSAALEPEQTLTIAEEPPPPPPTLSNGDFTDIGITNWKNQSTSKSYQGGGFKWGEGTASSWSAYVGSTIEVWQANGETFVELDGNATSYGIKQPIANARAGAFILAWKQSGRNDTKSGTNPYYVIIYYEGSEVGSQVQISKSATFSGYDKLKWTDNAHVFQITPEQIAAAAGKPIYVAFIPTSLNTYGTLIDKVALLPVEVIIPKLDLSGDQIDEEFVNAKELKVAKWENAFEGAGANGAVKENFIAWDKDRFYVRIPKGLAVGIEALKVATEDCPDSNYNDDPTRISFFTDGTDVMSDSMILVSDDQDDDFTESGAGADDQDDDRTHKIQLGGNFVIKLLVINGTEHNVNMKIPVPVRKVLQVDFIRMNVANVHDPAEIERSAKITKERYAQVGVKVDVNIINKPWPDLNPDRGDGIFRLFSGDQYVNGYHVGPMTDEYKSFINKTDSSGVNIYFLTSVYGSRGIALTPAQLQYESGEIDSKYFDKAFVNFASGALAGQTPAHELGHLLAYKTVDPDLDDHNESFSNLMHIGNYSNGVLSPKRFNEDQQSRIYQHSLLTNPP